MTFYSKKTVWNCNIIKDHLENLEIFIEVLPEKEEIEYCDVDCMDWGALELIE